MDDKHTLIIGIDFGSTFSGAAYATTRKPDNITSIIQWPHDKDSSVQYRKGRSEKVPTQLRYRDDGTSEWGFLVPADAHNDEVIRLIKLALDSGQVPDKSEAAAVIEGIKSAHDVDRLIADYISGLLDHVLATVKESLDEASIDAIPVKFIVTVPAIWTERSSERTVRALRQAPNFPSRGSISVVSEPEAAAIYTLHKTDRHDLHVGDCFLVVDAGGGTVDLISYVVSSLYPVLEVTEAAPGSGGMCGSQFLNGRFQQFLDGKLGKESNYDDEVRQAAMRHFELNTKRKFSTNAIPHSTFSIPVPGLAKNRNLGIIISGRVNLSASDLHMIFEPTVLKVIRLVKEQIIASNVPVRKVMLVGGFGQSTYLRERIYTAVNAESQQPIELMQPEMAWQAVVRGAVLKGLALHSPKEVAHIRIESRVARKHYGTEVGDAYSDDLHAFIKDQRWFDGFSGIWRVNIINWFIQRGEPVSEQVPFYKQMSMTKKVAFGRPTKINTKIYVDNSSIIAPLTRNDKTNILCVLEADLSAIPDENLDRERGVDGNMYYVVPFQIESVYKSMSTSYTLIHKGHRYPTVTTEYV